MTSAAQDAPTQPPNWLQWQKHLITTLLQDLVNAGLDVRRKVRGVTRTLLLLGSEIALAGRSIVVVSGKSDLPLSLLIVISTLPLSPHSIAADLQRAQELVRPRNFVADAVRHHRHADKDERGSAELHHGWCHCPRSCQEYRRRATFFSMPICTALFCTIYLCHGYLDYRACLAYGDNQILVQISIAVVRSATSYKLSYLLRLPGSTITAGTVPPPQCCHVMVQMDVTLFPVYNIHSKKPTNHTTAFLSLGQDAGAARLLAEH
eukprot:2418420-Rhodomonas_salina.1